LYVSEITFEAGESPEHIILRKDAERVTGSGEFWWGVDAPLGITVEVFAEQNGGTLPVLFSKSRIAEEPPRSQIRIWDAWRSLLHPQKHGRIAEEDDAIIMLAVRSAAFELVEIGAG
jgi:hypothetical protein